MKIFKIRELKNNLKWKIQRAKQGFSDCDVQDIDHWFLDIMSRMLNQLKETTHSAPLLPNTDCVTCHEEWERILDRMIFLLNEMDEDRCSYKNPYEEEYEGYLLNRFSNKELEEDVVLFKMWLGEESNKQNYINLCKREFFDLFSKYFYTLWS